MKLLNKFLFSALFLSTTLSFGQSKIKVTETRSKGIQLRGAEVFAINKKSDGSLLFLTKKLHRFGFRGGPGRLTFLSSLNADMKTKKEKQLPLTYLKKRIDYKDIKKIGTKYLLFFSFINEKLKKEVMFFVQIDPSDLTWYGKPHYLGDIPFKGIKGFYQGYFSISLSENNNFIILTGINPTPIKKKRGFFTRKISNSNEDRVVRELSFWLLNDKLQVVNHRKDFTIESKNGADLYMKRFKCDKDGNVFIVAENLKRRVSSKNKIGITGKKKKASTLKIENMSYNIFKLGIKEEDEIEYETNNEIFLVDLNIGFSPDGKYLDAVGILYDEITGIECATGVQTIRLLKEDFSEESSTTALFDPEFLKNINAFYLKAPKKTLTKNKSKRTKAAAKEKIKFYENGIKDLSNVNEVVYNSNGEVSAIMEKQWLEIVVERSTSTDSRGVTTTTTTTYYVWHYGDIILVGGLGDVDADPIMDFIPKNDFSLIKYPTGIEIESDHENWFIFGKSQLFKVDSETLKQTNYKITTKSSTGGGRMSGATTKYSNSLFHKTFNIGEKEFVGVQVRSRKRIIVVRLKAS